MFSKDYIIGKFLVKFWSPSDLCRKFGAISKLTFILILTDVIIQFATRCPMCVNFILNLNDCDSIQYKQI